MDTGEEGEKGRGAVRAERDEELTLGFRVWSATARDGGIAGNPAGGDAAEAGYVEDASVGSGPLGPIPGTGSKRRSWRSWRCSSIRAR